MHRTHVVPTLAATAAAALLVAGCSSSGSPTTARTPSSASSPTAAASVPTSASASVSVSVSAEHNSADVEFATDMIPHHRQAVAMADMAATNASNATVKALAAEIEAAQDPEITRMTAFLTAWKRPVPAESGAMSGMSMGGGSTVGMMSDADMTALGKATGAAFDRMWTTMMIAHHQGAVSMARTELANGANPQAEALARSIITSQNAQIARMRTLLSTLPAA